tara:strand:+ start:135 stop:377 length:243 start_codon:yes stop_codon:yes gene_type:complete
VNTQPDLKFYLFNNTFCFETAKRKRTCARICRIQPGEIHLARYSGDPEFRTNYCIKCGIKEIEKSRTAFEQLLKALYQLD